jgi:hypothetical protein
MRAEQRVWNEEHEPHNAAHRDGQNLYDWDASLARGRTFQKDPALRQLTVVHSASRRSLA